MSATHTAISWTDRTWNPIRGCSLVSPGCTHCYAMRQAGRFSGPRTALRGPGAQDQPGLHVDGEGAADREGSGRTAQVEEAAAGLRQQHE